MKRTGTAPECFDSKKRFAFIMKKNLQPMHNQNLQLAPPSQLNGLVAILKSGEVQGTHLFQKTRFLLTCLEKLHTDELNKWLSLFFFGNEESKGC